MKNVMLVLSMLCVSSSVLATPNFDRRLPNGAEIEIGERVFNEQIICQSCPFNADEFTRVDAKELVPRLERNGDLGRTMSYLERVSLQFYLVRTYRLNM